jgi:hypothetical protein
MAFVPRQPRVVTPRILKGDHMKSVIRPAHMHRALAAAVIVCFVGCGQDTAQTPTAPSTVASPVPSRAPAMFEVTFTADNACTTLPSVARSRTYSAVGTAGSPVISLGGANFGESADPAYPSKWNVIYQSQSDSAMTWWFQDPEVWELLGAGSYLVLYGGPVRIDREAGSLGPAAGEWPFWGWFSYCAKMEPDSYPECAVPEVTCESTQHRLTIVRR